MSDPTRRSVLRGAAAAGAVGVLAVPLAGCGDSSGSSSDGAPTGVGNDKPTGPITKAADVPLDGGKVLNVSGTKVVVTQPAKGSFKAFTAICTHTGCTVNSIADGVIRCPCHGSEYDASTGAVLKGPAPAPLATIPIAVQSGTISFA